MENPAYETDPRVMTPGSELLACHECDALQRVPALQSGQTARCRVCSAVLSRYPKGGLALLVLSNCFPFLVLEVQGRQQITTILGASRALYNAGMGELAVAVFVTSILAATLLIASSLYVLLAVRLRLMLPGARHALSWISHLAYGAVVVCFLWPDRGVGRGL